MMFQSYAVFPHMNVEKNVGYGLRKDGIAAAEIANRGTPVLKDSERAEGPALDAERFRFEMDYFLEHYVRGLRGIENPPEELTGALHALADRAADTPRRVLCHRDYHSRNLMVAADGSLAMVDIQDARWGPDTYDLASLLHDGYIEFDEDWIDPLIDLYLSALDGPPAEGFRTRLTRVSAQRKPTASISRLRPKRVARRWTTSTSPPRGRSVGMPSGATSTSIYRPPNRPRRRHRSLLRSTTWTCRECESPRASGTSWICQLLQKPRRRLPRCKTARPRPSTT